MLSMRLFVQGPSIGTTPGMMLFALNWAATLKNLPPRMLGCPGSGCLI